MKLTLTKISRINKDKQGNLLLTKDKRPYERLSVQCREFGTDWLSSFTAPWNLNWREGDVVEIELEKVEKDGKTYLNFKKPDELANIKQRLDKLEQTVYGKN